MFCALTLAKAGLNPRLLSEREMMQHEELRRQNITTKRGQLDLRATSTYLVVLKYLSDGKLNAVPSKCFTALFLRLCKKQVAQKNIFMG